MPVTYTNRKGLTYYLCQTTTKTGNPHYYFAREQKGEPMDEIPEGFEIGESVNGLVFLRKVRQMRILAKEIAAVEAAVKKHPKAHNYRVNVKHDRIEIYERVGKSPNEMLAQLKQTGLLVPGRANWVQERLEQRARFTPVLRFILTNEKQRSFRVERMHYGGRDEWFELGHTGPVKQLAQQLVPTLGTHSFFELF